MVSCFVLVGVAYGCGVLCRGFVDSGAGFVFGCVVFGVISFSCGVLFRCCFVCGFCVDVLIYFVSQLLWVGGFPALFVMLFDLEFRRLGLLVSLFCVGGL